MMRTTYKLAEISPADSQVFGGKATALRQLQEAGLRVPKTLCISTDAYRHFVRAEGLQEKLQLELHRKNFSDMRWEEIWDTALRIRNLFLRQPMDKALISELSQAVQVNFADNPVVVRSSAPEEDAAATSFAGLHESFVNIRGSKRIVEHIKLVWASLWSDRALLYRQELGLDIASSSMAVVVQELVSGEVSGVMFSINPVDAAEGIVEAVYGLNQGLVDGTVEPDRWVLDREAMTMKEHFSPLRKKYMAPQGDAVALVDLQKHELQQPPLSPAEVTTIYRMAKKIERIFGKPQDVEWTKAGSDFFILQSRPVTARQDNEGDDDDKRGWYLSLQRSQENLQKLRKKIELDHFPAMKHEAAELAKTDLHSMTDQTLAEELENRSRIKEKWTAIYWEDFIPFAHGMRLFGRLYNDTVRPADPFEFVEVLSNAPLLSKNRNRALREIADYTVHHPELRQRIIAGRFGDIEDEEFIRQLDNFIKLYGDPFCGTYDDKACSTSRENLVNVIMQLAASSLNEPEKKQGNRDHKAELEAAFLEKFNDRENHQRANILLDLARASYRLRDDDNILLGRIEEQFYRALQEGRRRLETRQLEGARHLDGCETVRSLLDKSYRPSSVPEEKKTADGENRYFRARQLLGQPAGQGIGRGRARVISNTKDLVSFQKGEVLVCDAIDPNMTFMVPLAAGIVERRGGMLIHGAIIAREYGIACVTGVPDAANLIHTGDEVTVDGYLGIVTVGKTDSDNFFLGAED